MKSKIGFLFCVTWMIQSHLPLFAAENPQNELQKKENESEETRNFYDVLEDVVADFDFELKNNQVRGLKNLSVRNIATSENIPPSFEDHLEQVIVNKIMSNSRSRIIKCVPCRSKTATLSTDKVRVLSPDSDSAALKRIARNHEIEHFIDVAFAYHRMGMILSMNISEAETGSIVWSRSYNSETSRAAAFRRGVDYSQTDQARTSADYIPTLQYRAIVYYLYERNINGYSGTIGFGFRLMERYDNRSKEVGFELNYINDVTALAGGDSNNSSIYSGLNLTLLFVHAWNFIGTIENYNKIRGSLFGAIGGTYASGFLGGLVRIGYEWRLGKHWGVSTILGYRPPSTEFLSSSEGTSISGFEFGLGVSALF